jgi:hypothetical protein
LVTEFDAFSSHIALDLIPKPSFPGEHLLGVFDRFVVTFDERKRRTVLETE